MVEILTAIYPLEVKSLSLVDLDSDLTVQHPFGARRIELGVKAYHNVSVSKIITTLPFTLFSC